MTRADIEKLLPHRKPFLLVDEVTSVKPGQRVTGLKFLEPDDPVFEGHFPTDPIMPGVLIAEACGQLGAIALALESGDVDERAQSGKATGYLASINKFKFHSPCRPGDTLEMTVSVGKRMQSLIQLVCAVKTGRRKVASGDLTVALQ
ncbi:3-hydroxyacyl-ACP dehydratase FabZ [Aestuariispira insulae]|uniref:3-hydroxyacyl-[acyl-carrier-protein] dehydratase n=1 Tax=Aestuariispira insulae TaxID=1461337 RepID=A0A3D9H4T1_9PROT|nr:3-hydroxyacyl-ACP dehydratase FabZ [Aestuariispira insulae]RED44181.1 3-hydroxyacyl-[acyl-carrier-protein] dehydratase [Aestuariispira insulae]